MLNLPRRCFEILCSNASKCATVLGFAVLDCTSTLRVVRTSRVASSVLLFHFFIIRQCDIFFIMLDYKSTFVLHAGLTDGRELAELNIICKMKNKKGHSLR